jgi:phosphoglycolate phosphatase-like HAD superfamily hydrolase
MDGVSPHGKTDPAIAREILRVRLGSESARNGEIAAILEAYISFLKDEVHASPRYTVLPGIVSLLDELLPRQDVMLGLATGNIEIGARIKLDRGGLNRYFTFGGFGSDSEDRTELVRELQRRRPTNMERRSTHIFVIGDTPLDIDAGKRAGFKTVGVGTGSYSVDQLLSSGATIAVQDLHQGRDYFLRSTFIE